MIPVKHKSQRLFVVLLQVFFDVMKSAFYALPSTYMFRFISCLSTIQVISNLTELLFLWGPMIFLTSESSHKLFSLLETVLSLFTLLISTYPLGSNLVIPSSRESSWRTLYSFSQFGLGFLLWLSLHPYLCSHCT